MGLLVAYLGVKTVYGLAKRIHDMAEQELYGEESLKERLLELQMRLELEDITEEEYMAAEAMLMERLDEGRRRRGED